MTKKEYNRIFSKESRVGFKVFRVNKKGELKSCVVEGAARIDYKVGEKNYAPKWLVKEKLYPTFFTTLEAAVRFKKGRREKRLQIWSVEGNYILRDLPEMCKVDPLGYGYFEYVGKNLWPGFTRMARSITPMKKIPFNEYKHIHFNL